MATTASNVAREDLVRIDPPALLGGSCPRCGRLSFPVERFCPHCGAPDPTVTPLPAEGRIYSFSIVRFPAPGYAGEVPYAVGIVELGGVIRVASTLLAEPLESLEIGAAARFELLEVESAGDPVTSYAHRQAAS